MTAAIPAPIAIGTNGLALSFSLPVFADTLSSVVCAGTESVSAAVVSAAVTSGDICSSSEAVSVSDAAKVNSFYACAASSMISAASNITEPSVIMTFKVWCPPASP